MASYTGARSRQLHVHVTCIVDRDESRAGSTFEGIPASALDPAVQNGARTLVAAALVYGGAIKAPIAERARERGCAVTVIAALQPRGTS